MLLQNSLTVENFYNHNLKGEGGGEEEGKGQNFLNAPLNLFNLFFFL